MGTTHPFNILVTWFGATLLPSLFFTLTGFIGLLLVTLSHSGAATSRLTHLLSGLLAFGFSWFTLRLYALTGLNSDWWQRCENGQSLSPEALKQIKARYDFTWTWGALVKMPTYLLFLGAAYELQTLTFTSPLVRLWLLVPSATIICLMVA